MSDDPFADIRQDLSGFGVLGGEAVQVLESAPSKATATGVEYLVHCEECGLRHRITVSWQELANGAVGVECPTLRYDRQTMMWAPHYGCTSCRSQLPLRITREECMRFLKAGKEAHRYDSKQMDAYVKSLAAQAAQYGRHHIGGHLAAHGGVDQAARIQAMAIHGITAMPAPFGVGAEWLERSLG